MIVCSGVSLGQVPRFVKWEKRVNEVPLIEPGLYLNSALDETVLICGAW